MTENRKNQPDRRKKHKATTTVSNKNVPLGTIEITTILEIKVNDVTYDRLCRTAEAFGEKATVEDVIQAMIQWHLKGGAPSPFFSGKHDLEAGWNILEECPSKLEPRRPDEQKK